MSHTPCRLVRFGAAVAVVASLAVSVGHAGSPGSAAYRVRVLPLDPNSVTGFNDRQQVIGYGSQDPFRAGFLWDAKHGLQFIDPSSGSTAGSPLVIPFDINQHGEVAAYRVVSPGPGDGLLRERSGAVLDLGRFVAGSLNDRGEIAGAAVLPSLEAVAVVWSAAAGLTTIGGPNSRAIDINNRGVVAGEVEGEAAVWTDIGVWQTLGFLGDSPSDGARLSNAQAINDRGWVVGNSTAPAGGAFLWTPQTGMENLGHLHAGHDVSLSFAVDINRHGTVIGESFGWILVAGEYEQVPPRSFVWTRRSGMLALDDLIPAGWTIIRVIDINDHDEILAAATDLADDSAHTVVLEPVKGRIQ